MRRFLRFLFEDYGGDAASEPDETLAPATRHQDISMTNEAAAVSDVDQTPSLRTRLDDIQSMSGAEFERYMANVFEALGYDATLVGGAGDQGVDLVLRKGAEVVAVQCKNYSQPVGNRPIQEVYAGARHHGVDHAWVVAPAGYTRGAWDLARSTGVALYDRTGIEALVRQADSRRVASAVLKDFDRRSYQSFLKVYSEMLDNLDSHCIMGAQHIREITQSPEAKEQFERTRANLYRYIGGLLEDFDALEGRNPELRAGELIATRQRLEARQRKIEQRAKKQGIFIEPTNVQNLSADAFTEQAVKASVSPGTSTPATEVPAKLGLAVGDTTILNTGDKLTLYTYTSPVPPSRGREPEAGYEISVIDVEVCASLDPRRLPSINAHDFSLQLPDNTRLETKYQHVDRELGATDLLPNDPVRGLVFFRRLRARSRKL